MLEGKTIYEIVHAPWRRMARAVGMHLVLRRSVRASTYSPADQGRIFPRAISFACATPVDSRTILDVMGSEHLLG